VPYTGAGSGITRALKFTPDIKFINDETLNEFVVTVERRDVEETDAKNDRDRDRDDREDKDREDRDKTLENSNLENNQDVKSVFSCRRLTPFRPFNLTIAYPYGKG